MQTRDQLFMGAVVLVSSIGGTKGRAVLKFVLPFILTAIVYDSQKIFGDWIRGPIHVSEPYYFDKFFFGIPTAKGVLTPNEWWQLHTSPWLDFITGVPYLLFFFLFIAISALFALILRKRNPGNNHLAFRMPWAFFWVNILGYSTYYWYPAAPPWYVALYGLGPAQLHVQAHIAGGARFDQLMGSPYFADLYGRAADVFGAVPSLHVAYPLLSVYFAFKFKMGRAACIGCIAFYLLMCFAAVYLNHHYILDILWGSAYALLVGWGINLYFDRTRQKI